MSSDGSCGGDSPRSCASQPDPVRSTTAFRPSGKLMHKLNKLAKWRIDSAAIEFPLGSPKFQGGFATVSRALLLRESGDRNVGTNSRLTESKKKGGGQRIKEKAVAVKKLKVENVKDPERVLKSALREMGILAELSHKNIVALEGFVEDVSQAKIWLVFPWAENGTLRDFVASADWEIPEQVWLIDEVARGVEYLHTRDPPICHGDLKSVNILVNSSYHAVITDFGSARRLTGKGTKTQTRKRKHRTSAFVLDATVCATTNTITLTGNEYTLRWAAPELLNEEEPSLASDIWALGWICYEVMTKKIPFEEITRPSVIIRNVIRGELPCVTDHVRMSLILSLCSLMIECWSIDPSKRPTAEDCRRSIDWMPMIKPDPQRTSDSAILGARSPELLAKLGHMHQSQNDYVNASKFYTEALVACADYSNLRVKADALWGLAEVQKFQSRFSKAVALYSQALDIWTEIGLRPERALALCGLAEVHQHQRNYCEAVMFYSQALDIHTALGDRHGTATTLLGLAEVHRLQGNHSEAFTFYSEAAEICTEMGDRYLTAFALRGLAELHQLRAEYIQAIYLFSEVLRIRTEIGDRHGQGIALMRLARAYRDLDHHTDAISLFKQAAETFQKIGHKKNAALASRNATDVRLRLERIPTD